MKMHFPHGFDNVALTLRHVKGDEFNGLASTISSGRNVQGQAAANASNVFEASLGLDSGGQSAFTPSEIKTEIGFDAGSGGVDYDFVTTTGWGESYSAAGGSNWNATVVENDMNRRYEKLKADAAIENITLASGSAHREGAYKSFQSDQYNGTLTLIHLFPDSQAQSKTGGPAFERTDFINADSWTFASGGGGSIVSTLGADGEVHSTGGSSGSAVESLSYSADAFFVRQFILPEVQDLFNDNRSAHYNQTIRSSASFDPQNPNASDPTPTITGDDRVVVTATQFHHHGKLILGTPMVTEVTLDLATGVTTIVTTIQMMGMDEEGSTGPINLSSTYTEPNWDPRTKYESSLDGVPLPPDQNTASDTITQLPPGYVYPTCNTSGKTWMDYIAGRRGDGIDQSINLASGLGDGFTGGLSTWIRQNANPFGDYVDYESGLYVGEEIVGTVGSTFVNPTGIAAKGSAIYNLYNKYDDAGRCANLATKLIQGGCFVAGTHVTVSSLPGIAPSSDAHWSDPNWLDAPNQEMPWLTPDRYSSVATCHWAPKRYQ